MGFSVDQVSGQKTTELSNYFCSCKLATCVPQSVVTTCGKCNTPFKDMIKHFALSCSDTEELLNLHLYLTLIL